MRKPLAKLLIASAFALSPAGSPAATVVGVYVPVTPNEVLLAALSLPNPGRYQVSFSLSRTGAGRLSASAIDTFEFYQNDTGAPVGGDDHPYGWDVFYAPPTTHWTRTFRVCSPYVLNDGSIRTEGSCFDGQASLTGAFTGSMPVNYVLTAERLADIPEPAAWALMILGFGVLGVALRRRWTVSASGTGP